MKTICIAGKNEIAVNALEYLLQHYPNFKYFILLNRTDNGNAIWQPSLKLKGKEKNIQEIQLSEVHKIKDLRFLSLEYC